MICSRRLMFFWSLNHLYATCFGQVSWSSLSFGLLANVCGGRRCEQHLVPISWFLFLVRRSLLSLKPREHGASFWIILQPADKARCDCTRAQRWRCRLSRRGSSKMATSTLRIS
ncbi:hypothetical protein BKA70DRAFT_1307501 [Coprinopsis sp. MPI-PUGE-AT-0042]|nr:hypothetical protein BKA70DRAFT_1307501 [Coprinopsis sp. MPI-PUGE-AT-0042]